MKSHTRFFQRVELYVTDPFSKGKKKEASKCKQRLLPLRMAIFEFHAEPDVNLSVVNQRKCPS